MYGTGEAGIERADHPANLDQTFGVSHRRAHQRFLQRSAAAASVPWRKVPGCRGHNLVVVDFALGIAEPVPQCAAHRIRQTDPTPCGGGVYALTVGAPGASWASQSSARRQIFSVSRALATSLSITDIPRR